MGELIASKIFKSFVICLGLSIFFSIVPFGQVKAQQVQRFQDTEIEFGDLSYLSKQQDQIVEDSLNFFRAQKFEDSIKIISKLQGSGKVQGIKELILGRNYLRLQKYDEANEAFEKAMKEKIQAKMLYYEYGQVLYARNQLREAKKSFRLSYKKAHMQSVSLYYLGHISQLLEQFKDAKNYYSNILKHEGADDGLKQIARFQLAESLLSMAREQNQKIRGRVKKYILPQIKEAYQMDPKSSVARDIKRREIEIKKEFALDPNTLINGRPIPTQRWDLRLSQEMSYDDNITFANDLPTTTSTQQGSYISTTKARGSHFWVLGPKRYVFTPELYIENIHHFDRHNSNVFQNDTYKIRPSLEFSIEHKLFNKQSSLIFNYEHNYTSRDKNANKERSFFARSNTFSLAERIKLFDFGDTTFRFRKDYYRAYDSSLDKDTSTFSVDQFAVLPNKHMFLAFFNFNQVRAENETNSSDSYLFRGDYFIPTLLRNYLFGGFVSFMSVDNFNDTSKESSDTILSYGLNISRRISKHFRVKLSYDYSNTTSDDPASEYTKHVSGVELKYSF